MDPQLEPIISDIEKHLKILPAKAKPFAVFDFDNTCSVNDIQQALMVYICRHELIRNPLLLDDLSDQNKPKLTENKKEYHETVFRHYWEMINSGITKKAYVYALQTLVGYRKDEIPELAKKVIEAQGSTLGKENYLGVDITKGIIRREITVALMKEVMAHGIQVTVISASPEVMVKAAMKYFDIPTTHCLGTNLQIKNGVFVDRLIEPTPIENGKIKCIQQFLSRTSPPLIGVGDTMNDFQMVGYSTIKVVVDRGNKLAEEAKNRGWYLLNDQ